MIDGESIMKKRLGIYMIGIIMVSLGIVLCKKCGMGISPISSIPFVLVYLTPFTFGTLTTMFHLLNTATQMILAKRFKDPFIWLQIPLALMFGIVIDFFNRIIVIDNTVLIAQILSLLFSVIFTAAGMVCMLDQNLIQNPPDGTVKLLSGISGKTLGNTKTAYDICCVIVSAAISLVGLHELKGFGIATIVSAVFVGRMIGWIRKGQDFILSRVKKNKK